MRNWRTYSIIGLFAVLFVWGYFFNWWVPWLGKKDLVEKVKTVVTKDRVTRVDIPYEWILTVKATARVKASNPRPSRKWKWDESYVLLACTTDPELEIDDPKNLNKQGIYPLKVPVKRFYKDWQKDFNEFSEMARTLVGLNVVIEKNYTTNKSILPGTKPKRKYKENVYVDKIGTLNVVVVPESRLSVIDTEEYLAKDDE